ncbi:tyrosine-type recombinase/integrase [Paucibacter sp. Y2R2-4]|uniref:tyrosine-type recombinase/integrase n=1 Tax=Paucibacter sp. Y2R2-4 TaxID=2893553 RepID=UPI0021E3E610|nr:site-specific integrase [Paucibacter sp. Y2R2-4]MCV2352285.1 integrase arm-type DNA-binding domain-containing protein [Paucibacter sp. Y2R2-4]
MLTELQLKNFSCPANKTKTRLADSDGLFLEATPNGSKRWFYRYTRLGKERVIALGHYCRAGSKTVETSLKDARAARDSERLKLKAGADPIQQRQLDKDESGRRSANTFGAIAREFHAKKASQWSDRYGKQWLKAVEKYLLPRLGTMPIAAINVRLLLDVLRPVEESGYLSVLQNLKESADQVFRLAVQTDRCAFNPASQLKDALQSHQGKSHAAILDPVQAGDLMRKIDACNAHPFTRAALKLSALTFQRPANITGMEWAWVDLEKAMISIPPEHMKGTKKQKAERTRPHLVPLSTQAVDILKGLGPLSGSGKYVFQSKLKRGTSMGRMTMNNALRGMGYTNSQMTAHGFRAMARTMMVEQLNINPEAIEAQLAHAKAGPLGSAYDRAQYMPERVAAMQAWADYLDKLKAGAQVLPFKAA